MASQAARQVQRAASALGRLQDPTPQRWQSMVLKRKKIEDKVRLLDENRKEQLTELRAAREQKFMSVMQSRVELTP